MAYTGRLNKNILSSIIVPVHKNFENLCYDISQAKKELVDFICKKCRIECMREPPKCIDAYDMLLVRDGLVMKIKGVTDIQYIFDMTNGKVYVTDCCIFSRFVDTTVEQYVRLLQMQNVVPRLI